MTGIVWMAGGEPYLRQNEKYLATMEENLRTNPYISGVFLHVSWTDVEGKKGAYDWSRLDRLITLCRAFDKRYKIAFMTGVHTPAWIFTGGAEGFPTRISNPNRKEYGREVVIPVPWDEVYLQHLHGLLAAAAARYNADPLFTAIVLTGVNYQSAEMHMPREKEDLARWQTYGDYRGKIVGAYTRLIRAYAALFPGKYVHLHVSQLFGADEEVGEIIRYGAEACPGFFMIQNCQLNGRSDNRDMFSYGLLMEYRGKLHVGAQNVAAFIGADYRNPDERQGGMEMTVYNWLQAGAEYLEVWQGDGADPAVCERLWRMMAEAREMGVEEYGASLKARGLFAP